MRNVSRTCLNFISAECLQAAGEDTCTAQLLTALALPPPDNPWKPGAVAGVVVGGADAARGRGTLYAPAGLALLPVLRIQCLLGP